MRWRGALGHGVAGERCGWAGAATGPPPDAVNAAPASWRRWRPLRVSRGLPAGSRGPAGRPTAKDGGETGKSVCGPRPGTPVDAEVDLDVIWMPGGLLVTDRLERGFL